MSKDNAAPGKSKKHGYFHGIKHLHYPSCVVIITHFNLAEHLKDALESVVGQTYDNWECLVIDDASLDDQFDAVQKIVDEISDPRVQLLRNNDNLGQTLSVFEGLRRTESQFVSFLDADDIWLPEYLEEMINMHLNPKIIAPYVCSNQFLVEAGKGVSASLVRSSYLIEHSKTGVEVIWKSPSSGHNLFYIEPTNPGWHRTATSSMVFRRSALEYCVPRDKLSKHNHADTFMSWGCHFLGGTLLYDKPLVIRKITGKNDFLVDAMFSSLQNSPSSNEKDKVKMKEDVIIALFDNNADQFFPIKYFKKIFINHKNLDYNYIISKRPELKNLFNYKIIKDRKSNNIINKFYYKIFDR